MIFTPIDPKTWPRAQTFRYFAEMAPTGYSLTAELDVTRLKAATDREGFRFFPAYLWLVTRELARQPEFCTAYCGDVLGYYDVLTPLYASFHEDDHTFSLMWTEYREDFRDFHAAYCENQELYGDVHGILSRPGTPPPNAYTVSCLPWTAFTHFAVHSYRDSKYFFPSVEAGRFTPRDGKLIMPLSLTCHHAATDGWHVSRFLEGVQASMDSFLT